MNQSPMGWYEDDDAPGLARWWDGDRWTEHTMVIPADLAADDEALPPRSGPTRFPRVDAPIPATAATRAAAPLDPTDVGTFEFGALGELETVDNPFFAAEAVLEAGV